MKFFSKKSSLLKAGAVAVVLAITVINYAQSNSNGHAPSLTIIKDANAVDYCKSLNNATCKFTTPDGLSHETTNAEKL